MRRLILALQSYIERANLNGQNADMLHVFTELHNHPQKDVIDVLSVLLNVVLKLQSHVNYFDELDRPCENYF